MLNMEQKTNILMVEDDDILIRYLESYFLKNGYNLISILKGEDISEVINSYHIELVILDVILPGKDGFYWLEWINSYHPHIPVVMASINGGEVDRLKGLEMGAYDFIPKPYFDKELLIKTKRILGHGNTRYKSRKIDFGDFIFNMEKNHIEKNNDELVQLTNHEANVLKLLCLNSGTTVSRDDIMIQVKGTIHDPRDRSIDIHINNLRKKIESTPSKPKYIHTVRGKGYQLRLPSK